VVAGSNPASRAILQDFLIIKVAISFEILLYSLPLNSHCLLV